MLIQAALPGQAHVAQRALRGNDADEGGDSIPLTLGTEVSRTARLNDALDDPAATTADLSFPVIDGKSADAPCCRVATRSALPRTQDESDRGDQLLEISFRYFGSWSSRIQLGLPQRLGYVNVAESGNQ